MKLDEYIAKAKVELEGESETTVLGYAINEMRKECYKCNVKRIVASHCMDIDTEHDASYDTVEVMAILTNGTMLMAKLPNDVQLGKEENWAIEYMLNMAMMFDCEMDNDVLQYILDDIERFTEMKNHNRFYELDECLIEEMA